MRTSECEMGLLPTAYFSWQLTTHNGQLTTHNGQLTTRLTSPHPGSTDPPDISA